MVFMTNAHQDFLRFLCVSEHMTKLKFNCSDQTVSTLHKMRHLDTIYTMREGINIIQNQFSISLG